MKIGGKTTIFVADIDADAAELFSVSGRNFFENEWTKMKPFCVLLILGFCFRNVLNKTVGPDLVRKNTIVD